MTKIEYVELTTRIKIHYPKWETNHEVEVLLSSYEIDGVIAVFMDHLSRSPFAPKYNDWIKGLKSLQVKKTRKNKKDFTDIYKMMDQKIDAYFKLHKKLPDAAWYGKTYKELCQNET